MVSYAVNVSKPEHITKTMHFVKKHNIRLIVCATPVTTTLPDPPVQEP